MTNIPPCSGVVGVQTLNKALTAHQRQSCQTPGGCRQAGLLTQPRKQSRKNGTCKCNFPLLHKCSDKSSTASCHGLIAVKSFDVPSANQSKQITVSPHPKHLIKNSSHVLTLRQMFMYFLLFQKANWWSHSSIRLWDRRSNLFHTLYWSERDKQDVHTASSPKPSNNFSSRKEFRKCPSFWWTDCHTHLKLFRAQNNERDKRAISSQQWGEC